MLLLRTATQPLCSVQATVFNKHFPKKYEG